jgi:UDP-4-amino-4,6-dideoxy-N-acetyl-beta-L-altrosamine transaminase
MAEIRIPYGRQSISDEDVAAVARVLRSDWLTQGPGVPSFEAALAARVAAPHAVAMNSATSVLHAACLALGAGPGTRVWTSPNSFAASANCARYCGAEVDFVDIDPGTYNLCPERLALKLEDAARRQTLPGIVIPVHFGGQPCDMPAIAALARRYGFRVIEDASHAVGARWDGEPVGSCRWSDVCVFSLHPVKIVTSAEGGVATTRDAEVAERLRLLRSHGMVRDRARFEFEDAGGWYHEQQLLGFNFRMTDVLAALGESQMGRLDEFLARRRELVAAYDRALAPLPLVLPHQHPSSASAWHLYVVQVDETRTRVTRRELYDRMRAAGIGVNVHYIPTHLHPYYRRLGFGPGMFSEAERYYARALTLPLYAGLSDEAQMEVVRALEGALG